MEMNDAFLEGLDALGEKFLGAPLRKSASGKLMFTTQDQGWWSPIGSSEKEVLEVLRDVFCDAGNEKWRAQQS